MKSSRLGYEEKENEDEADKYLNELNVLSGGG